MHRLARSACGTHERHGRTRVVGNYHRKHRPLKNLAIACVLGVATLPLIQDLGLATNLALMAVLTFGWRGLVDLGLSANLDDTYLA